MRLIQLGFACNNRCVFCAQGELASGRPRVDEGIVEATIASIVPDEEVAFVGGEPTLSDALARWLADAAGRGARRVVLQTNGRRLAYLGYARSLAAACPPLALDVSVHGTTTAMHDYHTSTPGSFGQTLRGLRHAKALAIPFGISVVVTRSNFRHAGDFVRLAAHVGARSLRLAFAEAHGSAARASDRVIPAPALCAPYLEAARLEAARVRLTLLLAGSEPTGLHAGIGETERLTTAKAERPEPRRLPLAKPMPGRGEERRPERKSGDELRQIFPGLFGASAEDPGEPPRG